MGEWGENGEDKREAADFRRTLLTEWLTGRRMGLVTEAFSMSPHGPPARPRVRPFRGSQGNARPDLAPGKVAERAASGRENGSAAGISQRGPCVAWDHYIWSRTAEPRRQMAEPLGAGAGPAAGRGLPLRPRVAGCSHVTSPSAALRPHLLGRVRPR